jgi:predicted metalloprotease
MQRIVRLWCVLCLLGSMAGPSGAEQSKESDRDVSSKRAGPPTDEVGRFVSRVLGATEVRWKQAFESVGQTYKMPTLVLFSGQTRADACGVAQTDGGPLYCAPDHKIYLDPSVFASIDRRLGGCQPNAGPCQIAHAYLIAHHVGHHVQNLMGIAAKVMEGQRDLSRSDMQRMQLRFDLQADCFAGVSLDRVFDSVKSVGPGALAVVLKAAAMTGDRNPITDLQVRSQSHASGGATSEQRARWFLTGLNSGTVGACNTFAADAQL